MKKYPILFLLPIFSLFINGCIQSKSELKHHHTSKVGGYINVSFNTKEALSLTVSNEITDKKLQVFYQNTSSNKKMLVSLENFADEVSLSKYTSDLESGYLFAVVSGHLNGQKISSASSYKLDEQEEIDYEKKLLNKRSLEYER